MGLVKGLRLVRGTNSKNIWESNLFQISMHVVKVLEF